MAKIVQFHRMSSSQAGQYTGPQGETIVDLGSYSLRVQDGITPGGFLTLNAALNLADIADASVARANLGAVSVVSPNFTGAPTVNGDIIATLTAAQTMANKQLNSPLLVTPNIGTPTFGDITNCIGMPTIDLTHATNLPAASLIGLGAAITALATVNITKLGVGMVPVNILDITQNQNNLSKVELLNNSAGVSAAMGYSLNNGTHVAQFIMHGTGYTSAGADIRDGGRLTCNGPGGLMFDVSNIANGNSGHTFEVNNNPVVRMYNTTELSIGNIGPVNYQLGLAAIGGNSLFCNGNIFGANATFAPAGSGTVTTRGFGLDGVYSSQGLTTADGNGIKMICVSAGVILANGASSWAAISSRELKENFSPILNAIEIVNAHDVQYGNYKGGTKCNAFLFWEDAQEFYPVASNYTPASIQEEKDKTGKIIATRKIEEQKTLEYTQYIPLLMQAVKDIDARLRKLEAK